MRPDPLHRDLETTRLEELDERGIVMGRPIRRHATGRERPPHEPHAGGPVEAVVAAGREGARAVVDIEDHRVVSAATEAFGDIPLDDRHSSVGETVGREPEGRVTIPAHHGRNQLRHVSVVLID